METRKTSLVIPIGSVVVAGSAVFGWWLNTYLLPLEASSRMLEKQVAVLESRLEVSERDIARIWKHVYSDRN